LGGLSLLLKHDAFSSGSACGPGTTTFSSELLPERYRSLTRDEVIRRVQQLKHQIQAGRG